MKQFFYILIVSIFMTSCATLVNRPHKYVTIHTTEPSQIIHEQDTIETIDNKVHLKTKRQNDVLSIAVVTDSLTTPVLIDPQNSLMFLANLSMGIYGVVGILVDRKNPKRYSYPDKIWINSDEKNGYSRFGQANNTGELYLHLSLPLINGFYMKPQNEGTKSGIGVGIITIGLDYYHSKNQFIHLGYSTLWGGTKNASDSIVGAGWFISNTIRVRESLFSDYFSLSNNHKFQHFSIGYGLSFAKNTWRYHKFERTVFFGLPFTSTINRVEKREYALGFVFPAYWQFGEYFNFGVVYRPTFYRANATDQFAYEHVISLDMMLKIRIKK